MTRSLPSTTPHEAMTELDNEGSAYTVTFNLAGCPGWYVDRKVYAHVPDWLCINGKDDKKQFVNMRHVIVLKINEV